MHWKQHYAKCPSMLELYALYIEAEKTGIQNDTLQLELATDEQYPALLELTMARMEDLSRVQAGGFIEVGNDIQFEKGAI